MNEKPPRSKLAELSEQVRNSEGQKIVDRLYKFEKSLKIFLCNFADLEKAIGQTMATHEFLDIRDTEKRKKLNNEMFEVVRHLHNTVAAAFSLVDHTRIFHNLY